MLDHVDTLLRHLLMTQVPGIQDETQVGFRPPDDDWRRYVSTLTVAGKPAPALNLYLVDLRERRDLRRSDWTTSVVDGFADRTPAPARVACHYFLTAWSPVLPTPAVEPALDEHHVLYGALAALFANIPLNARRIYGDGSGELAAVPPLLRDADLPLEVVPPEGFAALPYFWSAMGTDSRWRAGAYLVVTVPVLLPPTVAGPLVTTTTLEVAAMGGAADVPEIDVGGVLTGSGGTPVPGWLRLETTGGQGVRTTSAGSDGRFQFSGLRPGSYTVRVRTATGPEHWQAFPVPSASGRYDVALPAT